MLIQRHIYTFNGGNMLRATVIVVVDINSNAGRDSLHQCRDHKKGRNLVVTLLAMGK